MQTFDKKPKKASPKAYKPPVQQTKPDVSGVLESIEQASETIDYSKDVEEDGAVLDSLRTMIENLFTDCGCM